MRARSPRASSRDAILRVFAEHVADRGYADTSLGDIAAELNLSKGTIVHHFGTKEELWKEAVGWLMARFHDEFERYRPVLADLSASERQRVLFTVYGRFSARYPAYFRLLMLEGDQETKR